MDEKVLNEFVGKAVADVGAVLTGSMAALGDRLGLYRAMAGAGPVTSQELASRTSTAERYVREWLAAQAAAGYVEYCGGGRFLLPDEHAVALTDESSPACVIGAFQLALGSVHSTDRLTEAFRTGEGVAWGDHNADVHHGCERFFAPSYRAYLATSWLPALDGAAEKLASGARVADIGCGHGASTFAMAEAFPRATFVGFDAHEPSVAAARRRATELGVDDRVTFEVSTATDFEGTYDLACLCDCLHDMGDPAGACRNVRSRLEPDGAMCLVEPAAGDALEDNLNPVGAVYYAASTLLCTPSSLSQEVGTALGAQAGEARLREIVTTAGFSTLRRVAETPFNMVFEARP